MGKGCGEFLVSDHWDLFLELGTDYFSYEDEEDLEFLDKFVVLTDCLGKYPLRFVADVSSEEIQQYLAPLITTNAWKSSMIRFGAFFRK